MNEHLFLFTIGPVQSFISQARKTQDLYSGSYLLSHLCRTAGKKAQEFAGQDTIFPNLENPSIPNRFIIQFNTDQDFLRIGKEIENSVHSEIEQIANTILNKMNLDSPYHFYEQLRHYFSVNWLFHPIDDKGYGHAYQEIERLLGAIKNVRQFEQLQETGRKCSLDGQYNALFYKPRLNGRPLVYIEKNYNGSGDPIKIPHNDMRIQAGEGLSAVSFLKRFLKEADQLFSNKYPIDNKFPSTAEIALSETIEQLKRIPEGNVLLDKYKNHFEKHSYKFDHQLFFEENITTEYFRKNELERCVDDISQIRNCLKKLYQLAKNNSLSFNKYYALLMFDGDSMGEWLSGKRNKTEKENSLEDFHHELTKLLGQFAEYSNKYLQIPRGKTVYAGGDDFLGFVNLTHLFEVLRHLRQAFDKQIDVSEYSDQTMTFSAGVVIAHYKTPLSEVLKWTRKMEKTAKDMQNKNAFAVAVMKHSGEVEQTVLPWNSNLEYANLSNRWIPEIIENIAKGISKDRFSNTFIQNLSLELLSLKDEKDDIPRLNEEAIKYEIERLISRSFMDKKASEEERKVKIKKTSEAVYMLFRNCMENRKQQPVSNFLSALHIADFVSREVNYVD